MTPDEMAIELERLVAENKRLKARIAALELEADYAFSGRSSIRCLMTGYHGIFTTD